ncbi:hypothetical protein ViNHUV68_16160 [Vibrio sp. NH-UV-68]
MGLESAHGLRHAYAHQRYLELTGNSAPAAGGPSTKGLSGADKQRDYEARMCSGQLKLATVLEFSQYNRSDSLGVRPPLY